MQDDGDFTFAVAAPLSVGGGRRIGAGRVYPIFGRPWSPPRRRAPEQEPEPETTTATVRFPLGRPLLVDRARARAAQPPDEGGEPAKKTCYCSWCLAGLSSPAAKPARTRCRKNGSTGSSVLRWGQRLLSRSHSDGKEKFVFLDAMSPASEAERKGRKSGVGNERGGAWSYYAKAGAGGGVNGGRRSSFLPYRQDLVGLFGSATAFRRSYHPF